MGAVRAPVTLAEIAALLAVAQDHAFAQPPGAQLRATVLGVVGQLGQDAVDVAAPVGGIEALHGLDLRVGGDAGVGHGITMRRDLRRRRRENSHLRPAPGAPSQGQVRW